MNIQFFDRQEQSNPHQGAFTKDFDWVLERIDELRQRPPSFCELLSDNGCNLLLGVGPDYGCAQFSSRDGSPPYLMATNPHVETDEEFVEFLTANTDTPIPSRFCLPIESMREIAKEFMAAGNPSKQFLWEEV